MADNIDVTPGTGKTVATDDVGGVQYQVVKLDVGGNGASSPVTDLATSAAQTTGNGILTTIDADTGNIATSTASTDTKLTTTNSSLSSIDGKITAVNTGAVTVAASALPSGAATAAKQPALGTAGTASADVITIQGKTGMTPVVVDSSTLATSAQVGEVQASPTANTVLDRLKAIKTSIDASLPAGSNLLGKVGIDQTTPGTTNAVAATNLPTTVDTNSGNKSASTLRTVIATDQPNLTTPANRFIQPTATDNSLLKNKLICAATTNATSVKGSAGKIYHMEVTNSDTIGYFFKLYNKASAPTVGTDVPVATYFVPPSGGFILPKPLGSPFTTGIAFATTLLGTDADTTAVTTANKLITNVEYI